MSANNTQTSKALEKLSSGLRINRAGDDAAGLAISEKMRGQIRGLDQASRNAQDATSMLNTAEGNLSETQSILQRMKELATQAANDTNVGVDRGEIQKEINQLTSEINRIGNTTEFNTQKLLNGGTQITTNATVSAATLKGGSQNANVNVTGTTVAGGTNAVAAKWSSGAITTMGNGETNTMAFGGVTVTINTAGAAVAANATNNTTASVTVANGADAETIANALKAGFDAAIAKGGSPIANIAFSVSGTGAAAQLVATDTTADGATNNAWTMTKGGLGTLAIAQDSVAATGGTNTAGVTGVKASATFAFTGVPQEGSYITMADKKVAFWNSAGTNFSSAAEAKSVFGADFVVDINGSATGTAAATAAFGAIGAAGITGYTLADSGAGTLTLTANAAGVDPSTKLQAATSIATGNVNASGTINFTGVPAEGSNITVAGKTIGFYDSSKGNYDNDVTAAAGLKTDFVVDVKGLDVSGTVDKIAALQTSMNAVLTNDVNLGKNTSADGSYNLVVTAQTAGFGGNKISLAKSADTTSGFDATFQIGANMGQSMTIDIKDMRSAALAVAGDTAGGKASVDGAVFTATKTVNNGTDSTGVEYALDVSDYKKATAAIKVISNAIESVSAERSKIGAYTNRLEHTVNNLTTSSENMTAAESRIRDVDMAKEMMNFQKNNILAQAAQAMLAQANQQPQGVLQLLR